MPCLAHPTQTSSPTRHALHTKSPTHRPPNPRNPRAQKLLLLLSIPKIFLSAPATQNTTLSRRRKTKYPTKCILCTLSILRASVSIPLRRLLVPRLQSLRILLAFRLMTSTRGKQHSCRCLWFLGELRSCSLGEGRGGKEGESKCQSARDKQLWRKSRNNQTPGRQSSKNQKRTIHSARNTNADSLQQTPRHPQEALRPPHHPAEYAILSLPFCKTQHTNNNQQRTSRSWANRRYQS